MNCKEVLEGLAFPTKNRVRSSKFGEFEAKAAESACHDAGEQPSDQPNLRIAFKVPRW